MTHSPEDTIAAIATPLGEGGLGVIRVSGATAIAIVRSIFRPAKPGDLSGVPSHTCHLGHIVDDISKDGATTVDQAVVAVFRAPHSYTGEDVVEISAHGSPFILQRILELCFSRGARAAEPGEFTQRAFLNGKIDLTQAEAVADLIHSRTEASRAAAMAQLEGRLAEEVRRLRDRLLPLLAHVEVGLDHSDEDHDFLQRDALAANCRSVQDGIEALLASSRVGHILRQGLRVTIVGRPNVGKSSLMNALLKKDRAIVTPIPGTTRDTLEETVDWDGVPVVLTDTAGLRNDAPDPVEKLGMARTRQALESADVVIGLFDGSQALQDEDADVRETCFSKPHLWVATKCDLPAAWDLKEIPLPSRERIKVRDGRLAVATRQHPSSQPSPLKGEGDFIRVSSKTGDGLPSLIAAVKKVALQGCASSGQAEWMLNARHRHALERAHQALGQATQAAQSDAFEECVALELQTALQALGEIVGETATEELLGQIFSQFCVGK